MTPDDMISIYEAVSPLERNGHQDIANQLKRIIWEARAHPERQYRPGQVERDYAGSGDR